MKRIHTFHTLSLLKKLYLISFVLLALGFMSCEQSVDRNYGFESSLVEIKKEGGQYQLWVEGKPFFIKGIAGRDRLDSLVSAGGNCVRTWSTAGLDTLLDAAHARGLRVMVGLDVTPGRLGLDYTKQEMLDKQKKLVKESVLKYKDHPALLLWSVGNELDLSYDEKALYPAINDLALLVKSLDDKHPVSISVGVQERWINSVARYCPDIDILAINIFKRLPSIQTRFEEKFLWEGPYIFSEWSNRGFWEGGYTDWDAPIEDPSFVKGQQFVDYYKNGIQQNPQCLGGFVFYWGHKQERTHTWFSLFSEDGEKNSRYDAVYYYWQDKWPSNRAPDIKDIQLNYKPYTQSIYLDQGLPYEAKFDVYDPDGDSLEISWEVLEEGDYRAIYGGDKEKKPTAIEGLDAKATPNSLSFKAPPYAGAYRLFIYARDGKGSFGAANIPFYVQETKLLGELRD